MLPQSFATCIARGCHVAVDIVMPRLSDSMEEGTVLRWLVDEGAPVVEGEPLVEVETDKASVTYESEHDGTLLTIVTGVRESIEAVVRTPCRFGKFHSRTRQMRGTKRRLS